MFIFWKREKFFKKSFYEIVNLQIIIFHQENKSIRDFIGWLKESKWFSWVLI